MPVFFPAFFSPSWQRINHSNTYTLYVRAHTFALSYSTHNERDICVCRAIILTQHTPSTPPHEEQQNTHIASASAPAFSHPYTLHLQTENTKEETPIRDSLHLLHYIMEEIAMIVDALTSLDEGNEEMILNLRHSYTS